MDLLRSFVTIADLGGFTAAAETLGRSQPAISLQVKRLEELVGKNLFSRASQQLELTPSGDTLYGYARRILALNDEALAQFEQPEVAGRVRFGTPSEFASTLLPKVIGHFNQTYPGVALEVTCDLSRNLRSKQRQGEFDLIIALYDTPPAKQQKMQIKDDELVWVASPQYDWQRQTSISLVAAPEPCLYRARATHHLNQSGQPWQIVYTNPDFSGIIAALESGLGVTALARSTVPDHLRIIRANERLPALGKIRIGMHVEGGNAQHAAEKLAEYVWHSLG